MILSGIIEINGVQFTATVNVTENNKRKNHGQPHAYQMPNGKWRGFKRVDGKQKSFGCHDTRFAALEAARHERKPSRIKTDSYGVYLTSKGAGKPPAFRVILRIARGRTLRLGDYQTWAQAILVRDVVARRAGIKPYLLNYEMPLTLISNAVARSFIRDRVETPTPDQIADYMRRVDDMNAARRLETGE